MQALRQRVNGRKAAVLRTQAPAREPAANALAPLPAQCGPTNAMPLRQGAERIECSRIGVNTMASKTPRKPAKVAKKAAVRSAAAKAAKPRAAAAKAQPEVHLLSGGNPQIAKGNGNAPV